MDHLVKTQINIRSRIDFGRHRIAALTRKKLFFIFKKQIARKQFNSSTFELMLNYLKKMI